MLSQLVSDYAVASGHAKHFGQGWLMLGCPLIAHWCLEMLHAVHENLVSGLKHA